MEKIARRYWGYLALVLVVLGWATHLFGYALILILSLVALIYFLVQAPLSCCAEIRSGLRCRNNSHGLLLGCWVRQHKWQRFRDVFVSRKWRETLHSLFASPRDQLATAGGLASVVSLILALVVLK